MSWSTSFPTPAISDRGESSASPPFQLPPLGPPQNTAAASAGPYLPSGLPSGTHAVLPRLPIPHDAVPVGAQLIGRVVDAVALLNSQFPAYHFTVRPDGGLSIVTSTDGQRVTSCPFPNCEMGFTNRRSNCISRHYQTEHAPNTLPFLCGGQCRSRTNRRDHFLSHLKRNKARCAAYLIHQVQVDPDVDKMLRLLYPESREPSWQVALVRDTNASMVDAQLRKLGTCLEIMVPGAANIVPPNPPSSLPPQVPSHPLHAPLPFPVVNGAISSLQPIPTFQQQTAYPNAPRGHQLGPFPQQQYHPDQRFLAAPVSSHVPQHLPSSHRTSYTTTRAPGPGLPNSTIQHSFSQPYTSQPLASAFGPFNHPTSAPTPQPQYSTTQAYSSTWTPSSSDPHPPRSSQLAAQGSPETLAGWNVLPAIVPPTSHAYQQYPVPAAQDDLSWLTGPATFQAPIGTAITHPNPLPPIPVAADSSHAPLASTYTYSASLSPANSSPLVINSGHSTKTPMTGSRQGSSAASAQDFGGVGDGGRSGQLYLDSVVGRGLAPPPA